MKLITEEAQKVEFITEGKGDNKKMYIEGIFLQGDICNRNGRMYPMTTLAKEVMRYNENFVNKGRALGELGHPCLSGDAKLLSVLGGWKHIQDCAEGESVYTMNPDTKEVEIHPIKKVVVNDHKGVMYNLKNRGINTKVTPDHRFLIINSRNHNEYKFITAEEIYRDLTGENKLSKWYIPRYSLGLNRETLEYYVIPKSSTLKVVNESTKKYLDDLKIEFNTFAAFMGLYLSEGNTRKAPNGSYGISIYQNEGPKADQIREILYSMEGLEWNEIGNDHKVIWSCFDRRLGEYLHHLGICYNKYVPKDFIEQLDSESARTFIDYFVLGDGRGNIDDKYVSCDAFSTSEQLMDDIAQIAVIAGIGVSRFVEICEKDYIFAGRIIKAENKSPLYFCRFLSTRGAYLDNRFMQMEVEEWDDKVYCIQVENTNFMVEQNGYTYWTGNCGPTVNLDRVSHKIISLEQRGTNFRGKAQLLETPMGKIAMSLIKEGVCLGVSSRGVGSLQMTNEGHKIVGNDFMLATAADIVADPSAPDAFVQGIYEGVDWIYDASKNEWLIDETKKKINRLVESREYQERKLELFNDFLNSL
jgi:hypothetical protein